MAATLDETARADVEAALDRQRQCVEGALERAGMATPSSQALAEYVVAVRQSLAVLHRSGRDEVQVRPTVTFH